MKTKKLLFYSLAAILVGCVPVMSLHPLYNKEEVVFEKNLLGTWVNDSNETAWEFNCPNEPEKAYELIYTDKEGKKGSFKVFLVNLKGKLFMDVSPSQFPSGQLNDPNEALWPYNQFFFVPTHTFIKVGSVEPQLSILITDDEEMKKLLKEDPNAVKHESLEDGGFILTASTKELQAFVLKYADDKRIFTKEIVLSRKKCKSSKEPKTVGPNAIEPKKD